jgi:dynein intermediate chain
MSSVTGELAQKKARLAELRRAKEARAAAPLPPRAAAQSVEDILASVGIAPAALIMPAVPAPARPLVPPEPPPPATVADADPVDAGGEARSSRRAPGALSLSDAIVLDIPGRSAVEVYEKVTQTEAEAEEEPAADASGAHPHSAVPVANSQQPSHADGGDGSMAPIATSDEQAEPRPAKVEVLSDAEWQAIQSKEDFGDFFWKSARVMERALGLQEVYDILKDYSADNADNADKEERSKLLRRTGARVLCSPQRCAGRPVSCLEWSPHHPELVIAAYHLEQGGSARMAGVAGVDEGEGLVCVWNTRSGQCEQPEYVLSCEAVVTALCAHVYSPHCFVGGTRVGQIVLWDLRASTAPVARSPLSCNCHIHPIVGVEMIGSQHAHRSVVGPQAPPVPPVYPAQLCEADFIPCRTPPAAGEGWGAPRLPVA